MCKTSNAWATCMCNSAYASDHVNKTAASRLECAGGECKCPMEMLDHSMTKHVAKESARNPGEKCTTLQCFNCGCEEGLCFVVMKRKSVQKMQLEGRGIRCPIHQSSITTSTYARRFYACIRQVQCRVQGIVWDWFDVPDDHKSNHKMHIDASVFHGASCMRFEIDGETHFHSNGTERDGNDEIKDHILRAYGVGMLRLHYRDVEHWTQYIGFAINTKLQTVCYTSSYRECLHPADHKHIIDLE